MIQINEMLLLSCGVAQQSQAMAGRDSDFWYRQTKIDKLTSELAAPAQAGAHACEALDDIPGVFAFAN